MNKPEFETVKRIDILLVLEWCDKIKDGLKDRVWNYIINDTDYGYFNNDTTVKINLNPDQLFRASQEVVGIVSLLYRNSQKSLITM